MGRKLDNEKGISLLLGALFVFFFTGLAALVFGLGIVASGKSRIQNTANLVALGVIENITKQGSSINAVSRANQIASSNAVVGAAPLGDINDTIAGGPGGRIEYGVWHYFDNGVDPCAGNYPCFLPQTAYTADVNAVKVTVRNQLGTNPIMMPFATAFGYGGGYVSTEATALLAGQCSIILQDVSLSTTYDTHRPDDPDPAKRSIFAFHNDSGAYSAFTCPTASTQYFHSRFCAMLDARGSNPTVPDIHYRSDYALRSSVFGPSSVMVDTFEDDPLYKGPEPFRTLFLAANAGLRLLFNGSTGSLWRGLGFEHQTSLPTPSKWVPEAGFASNPGILVQATNINNRGVNGSAELRPNFLDFGWFPNSWANTYPYKSEKTNIIEAFEWAIDAFGDQSLSSSCPSAFKKTIVLLTDGVGNCYKDDVGDYTCEDSYDSFLQYRNQLLGVISDELDRKNISVVVIYAGRKVGPHFINRDAAGAGFATASGSKYFDLQEAIANGYGAFNEAAPKYKVFDETPDVDATAYAAWCATSTVCSATCSDVSCRNRFAMENLELPGSVFRQAGSVLAQLAIDSDGVFCPLLPVDPDATRYRDDGDPNTIDPLIDDFRVLNGRQEYAVYNISESEQAARCIQSKWRNKFILAEDEN